MTPAKRRLDFLVRRCCGLRPSLLMQLWYVNQANVSLAVKLFAEWAFAMAILKLRCFKRFYSKFEERARFISCKLLEMDDVELEPCGLIRIPKLKRKTPDEGTVDELEKEDVLDLPDEDLEHDDSDWY